MEFKNLKEAEFWRLAETLTLSDFTLCESNNDPGKFHLLAQQPSKKIAFSIRHARTNTPRTWRLDIIAKALHQRGITEFHVRMQPTVNQDT
ncbi:hypothetical protein ACPV5G_19920 [Photobacterium damselae]|uniref:hypothetical protein n=2 Tax=Photobacterium damselae TaxID=38293 RepID=UPI004069110B